MLGAGRMKYPVNEVFATIQGEATFTGTPAVFVRFQGCNVGCAFCDTKHTWGLDLAQRTSATDVLGKKKDGAEFAEFAIGDLVETVQRVARGSRHVVLTGGEPADYDLEPLVDMLAARGFRTQIETSGTARVRDGGLAFVTVSPKIRQAGGLDVLRETVARADEIKHPTSTETHFGQLRELLAREWHRPGIPIWLQPLSQHPLATRRCVDWCQEYGYRLSLQTHKYLGLR